jgi:hypothetical protein
MVMKLQINIFTTDLVWVGTVDSVFSLVHRSSWHEIPNSEISISRTAQGVEEMTIGRILVINNQLDKALIIEDKSSSLDDEYWNFTCIPLKAILNYRICHPLDAGTFTNLRQSEVMTGIVSQNLITQNRDLDRKFWSTGRTKNLLSVVSGRVFGDLINFTVDWKTGEMGETMTALANMYGKEANYPLGWNIYIKPDFSGYEFNVWYGTHKHVNQTNNNPVVFSEEFGNIKNATYTYSIKEWRNVTYMIWKNGDIEAEAPVGNYLEGWTESFNRKEMIINSNKKVINEAIDEGYSELNKRPHVESFEAEIIHNPNTMSTYLVDWKLGDIVTIQSRALLKDTLLSIDAMVTEVEESYSEGLYSINATFGEGKLTFMQILKNAIDKKGR